MPPYPPPGPEAQPEIQIVSLHAGQPVLIDGEETICTADSVVLIISRHGEQVGRLLMTPEEALAVGTMLGRSAGALINAEVDEDGKPTSLAHRYQRLEAGRLKADPPKHPRPYTPGWMGKATDLFAERINAAKVEGNLGDVERVPFNAEADTDGDSPALQKLRRLRHNHFTRDMKQDGSCPACVDYFNRHGLPEEED